MIYKGKNYTVPGAFRTCIEMVRDEAAKQAQMCVDATDLFDDARHLNCSEALHKLADRMELKLATVPPALEDAA